MKYVYGYVVKNPETGQYFTGCGYGGPGNPVPYFRSELKAAKVYKMPAPARKAAARFGGELGFVVLDQRGEPVEFKGYVVPCGAYDRHQ